MSSVAIFSLYKKPEVNKLINKFLRVWEWRETSSKPIMLSGNSLEADARTNLGWQLSKYITIKL